MPDNIRVHFTDGKPDLTGLDPTNSSTAEDATHVGSRHYLIGPPVYGAPNTMGLYERQVAGTAGEYRWLQDIDTNVAALTSYSYRGGWPTHY